MDELAKEFIWGYLERDQAVSFSINPLTGEVKDVKSADPKLVEKIRDDMVIEGLESQFE